MAISYVSGLSFSGAATTTVTPSLPTGWAADDLHVMVIANAITSVTYTTPTGYTVLDTGTADTAMSAIAYYRILQTGDVARAIGFTSSRYNGHSFAFRGVDATTPFDGHNVKNITSSTTAASTTSITPTVATDVAVCVNTSTLASTSASAQTTTTPTGYTLASVTGSNPSTQGTGNVRYVSSQVSYKALSSLSAEAPGATLNLTSAHRNFLMMLKQEVVVSVSLTTQHFSWQAINRASTY